VGKDRLIEYYEVRPWIGPGMLRFPAEDVIHLRFKSPIHKIDGFSHLTAGAEWIDTQESVNRSRFFQFKNGCFPLGNLKLGDRYVDLDDEDMDRLYAKFFARFQGESNAGRPIITPPDSEYVPLTINPTEMDYVQSSDQLRDNILATWGVPKEIAGIQDAGSEIAMYGPMQQFAENALIPRAVYIGQVLTEKLCSRWDKTLRFWWPHDELVGENPVEKRETLKMRYDTQSITSNEIRAAYGEQPLPGGDAINDPKPHLPAPGQPGAGPGAAPSTNGNGRIPARM
jgi:HK97 family phage portal protein